MRFCSKLLIFLAFSLVILTFFLSRNPDLDSNSFVNLSKSETLSKINGGFTCQTWNSSSYINVEKYEKCLTSKRDESFWPVANIRHSAYKNYLNSSSLIIEVGGNIGHDTEKFINMYNCSIISYEPIRSMSKELVRRFQTNNKIMIRPFGLGSSNRTLSIRLEGNDNAGTNVFQNHPSLNDSHSEPIEILNIVDEIHWIRKNRTSNGIIDMISINCEGCELEILPAMIRTNLTQYFRIIQFSTHIHLVDETSCIYCQIEQALEQTHQINYHYNLLWEGWVKKEV